MKTLYVLFAASFLLQAGLSPKLDAWVHPAAFEEKGTGFEKNVPSTFRAAALLTGLKTAASHLFWIKVLLYYGDSDNAADRYSRIYSYCSLASDLNPAFLPTYQFGASVLAFHVKRVEEAVRLLQKGIEANPGERSAPLQVLLAAIAYQHGEQYDKVIPRLEALLVTGNAPALMTHILANMYEKVGRYGDAVALWQRILRTTEEPEERIEAAQRLQEVYKSQKNNKIGTVKGF